MKEFSLPAKLFIITSLLVGSLLTVWQLTNLDRQSVGLLLVTCLLASVLQAFKVEGSTARTSYNLSWVVYGFSLVLLGPPATMLVILFSHTVEWIWHKYPWYIQTFNIASFAIAVTVSGLAYAWISPTAEPLSLAGSLAILTGAALFTFVNHMMVGLAVNLARGQRVVESGVLGALTLSLDAGMLCLGATGALIWLVNPYAVILVALLAILLQNVLRVPALRRQSETDPKLGIYNARYFDKACKQELNRANRFNRPLTLVIADMDLLRQVNNRFGHLAGDAVLNGVAQILQSTAGEYDVVARFGGEEFAILMPEIEPEKASFVVEEMRQAIEAAEISVETSVTPIKVTMSFGLAARLDEDLSSNELIHFADLAVYEAKQEGRNCVRIYGAEAPNLDSQLNEAMPDQSTEANSEPEAPVKELPIESQETPVAAVTEPSTPEVPAGQPEEVTPASQQANPWRINLYVGAVALTALTLGTLFIYPGQINDWLGLIAFFILVVLVEALAVSIYVKETSVSTSVAPLLAGVLLFGPFAALFLGLGVALAAYFRQRSRLDRLLFNSSNHVIGGLVVAGLVVFLGRQLPSMPVPAQIAVSLVGSMLIFFTTTILVAGAVSLNGRQPLRDVWRERFGWLAPYYLALGVVGYALIFSYLTAGLLGILVIMVPLLMLRFSQKQFIDHTKAVVSQLKNNNIRLTQQAGEINLLNEELLVVLAKATDLRDPYVMEHSLNVARYAELIAQEMDLPDTQTELVRKAGLLHDIGKLSIPDAILFKPAKLTDEEYAQIKGHAQTGADIIQECHSLAPLVPIITHHHECYDGSGYPNGLAGEDIPLEARILGLADAVEAMASDRPYRRGRSPYGIVDELLKFSGRQFDPQVVQALIRVLQKQGQSVIVNSARYVEAREDMPGKHKAAPLNGQRLTTEPILATT